MVAHARAIAPLADALSAQVKGSGYPGIFVAQSLLRHTALYTVDSC